VSVVVSDSGPVHYLILCGVVDVIPKLYSELVIPTAVARELSHPSAPIEVSKWIQKLPPWTKIQKPALIDSAAQLGPGEREAIAVALEIKASQLLIDDRVARGVAVNRGLVVAGTVGVLEQAAMNGLINLSEVFQKLLRTNFRIDADVLREALDRDAVRRKAGTGE
jgi:predicted nucleic acid-binding protein